MSAFQVFVAPSALRVVKSLPGHVRQRAKRAIDALEEDPKPSTSAALDTTNLELAKDCELRRIRIDTWRIIYLVTESELTIDVLAVRKRPPYDYGDLAQLLLPSE